MWCARVAICQHRLECLAGSILNAWPVRWNNASMDRVIDLLNSTFIRFSNLASKI